MDSFDFFWKDDIKYVWACGLLFGTSFNSLQLANLSIVLWSVNTWRSLLKNLQSLCFLEKFSVAFSFCILINSFVTHVDHILEYPHDWFVLILKTYLWRGFGPLLPYFLNSHINFGIRFYLSKIVFIKDDDYVKLNI